MSDTIETVVHPITRWTIAPAEEHGIIVMRLQFLADPLQQQAEPQPSRIYGMTADQARSVAQKLLAAADQLAAHGAHRPPHLH